VLYTNTVEHSRTAEAKSNLGAIRSMAMVYYQENNAYPDDTYLSGTLGLPTGTNNTCSNANYFFQYHIDNVGDATAYRCTSGGKSRDSATSYSLTLTPAGAGSSSPAGWW
jgi:Tfp pilus assembly protein PilE